MGTSLGDATSDLRLMHDGALAGLRVVELSRRAAGAFCGKLLSDLGAQVVTLEDRRSGAADREPLVDVYRNTGKIRLTLEGSRPEAVSTADAERFSVLLADADVLIDDIGHPLLATLDPSQHPQLVWCSIRPFGLDGPYADFAASHLTIFHGGGEGHLLPSGLGWTMFPDRPPIQIGAGVAEHDSGVTAAVAVVAAIRHRRLTGRGQRIDVSDQEAQLTLNRTRLSRYNNDGVVMHRTASPYPLGGMLACLDGYVQLVGITEEHWTRLGNTDDARCFVEPPFDSAAARAQNVAELAALLRDWCSKRLRRDVVSLLSSVGCPIGEYAEPAELQSSEQLQHRGFFHEVALGDGATVALPGAPYRFSRTPVQVRPPAVAHSFAGFQARPVPESPTASLPIDPLSIDRLPVGPLHGVRIVDFTWAAAGPYATLLLALLGAEVIKIESSRRPDMARRGFLAYYGHPERSPNFNELNLNKRSVCVDLTNERGREIVEGLIARSDVVVDNFRPGVLSRLGFGPERLLADYPALVVASSSANGSTGPDAAGAGLASIFGATGSLSAQTGYADGPPSEIGESTDYRSANFLALAILAGLTHRERTGEGQHIDLSSREVVTMLAAQGYLDHLETPGLALRMGNRHREIAPHGVYAAAGDDAWIALALTDESAWPSLCHLIGRPEWVSLYGSVQQRKAHEDTIDTALSAWTSTKTASESFRELQAIGVAACPSFTNEQLAADPHLKARELFVPLEHPVIGPVTVLRAPWRMSEAPCAIERHGPLLGQDAESVLGSLLGLSPDEVAALGDVLT